MQKRNKMKKTGKFITEKKFIGRSLGKNVPVSPRRMLLVANLIRGKSVDNVIDFLRFDNRKASRYILQLLSNAVSNVTLDNKSNLSKIILSDVMIGQGIVLKNRGDLGPRGRFKPMKRRTTNIRICLEEKVSSLDNIK